MLRQRRDGWIERAFIAIALVSGTIMLLVALYAIHICNKLSPEEAKKQGYKEWTMKGEGR